MVRPSVVGHNREVIEPGRIPRSRRADRRYRHHQIIEQCCARKRVRSTAREAPDGAPLNADRLTDCANVDGAISDTPSGSCRGLAIAWAVIGDQRQSSNSRVLHPAVV